MEIVENTIKKNRRALVCLFCKNTFYYSIFVRAPKYCSEECRKARNRQLSLEKYHKQKDITSVSTAQWTMYKMRQESCIRCGFNEIVNLHDIIPANEGGNRYDPDNRIPLCPNCHETLHKGIWKIWDIEGKLYDDIRYQTQYWIVQILKTDNHNYTYKTPSYQTKIDKEKKRLGL